jgi:hypothetical protein
MDLGVYYSVTGLPLKQVASTPATGEYTVSSVGVYTFAVGDASAVLLFNYLYEGLNGGTLTVTNALMGTTPKFQLVASQVYDGNSFTVILYSCVADKLSMPLKQDDYLIAELSGSAHADVSNKVLKISTTSISGGGN